MIIQLKEHYFIFYESLIILNISIFLSNFSEGVPASVLVCCIFGLWCQRISISLQEVSWFCTKLPCNKRKLKKIDMTILSKITCTATATRITATDGSGNWGCCSGLRFKAMETGIISSKDQGPLHMCWFLAVTYR